MFDTQIMNHCFDEARDRLQTKIKNKTLQHDFLLVIYVSQLSFLME